MASQFSDTTCSDFIRLVSLFNVIQRIAPDDQPEIIEVARIGARMAEDFCESLERVMK